MKRRKLRGALLVLLVLAAFLVGFAQKETGAESPVEPVSKSGGEYTFRKCSPDKLMLAGDLFCLRHVHESDFQAKTHSLFIGQVLTLFGEPDYVTNDMEDLFSCAVQAEDRDGNCLYLEIYYGPSGPAIAGSHGEAYQRAADELAELIEAAKPTDFCWECVYEDVGVTVIFSVRKGKPYYENVFSKELMDELGWDIEEKPTSKIKDTSEIETQPKIVFLYLAQVAMLLFFGWKFLKVVIGFRGIIRASRALKICEKDDSYIALYNEELKNVRYKQVVCLEIVFFVVDLMLLVYVRQTRLPLLITAFGLMTAEHVVALIRLPFLYQNRELAYVSEAGIVAAEGIYTKKGFQFWLEQENKDNGKTYVNVCGKVKKDLRAKFLAAERIIEIKELLKKINETN